MSSLVRESLTRTINSSGIFQPKTCKASNRKIFKSHPETDLKSENTILCSHPSISPSVIWPEYSFALMMEFSAVPRFGDDASGEQSTIYWAIFKFL